MNITAFIHRYRNLWVPGSLIVILIVLATLPFYGPFLGMSMRDLYIPAVALMYSALAVSWTMFSGITSYLSLGTAAFFGVGIYTTALLRPPPLELPLGVIIAVAVIASFAIALLVGLVTLRLKGIYFAIFTFGLVVLVGQLVLYYEIIILNIRGRSVPPTSFENMYWIMLGIAVATLLVAYFFRRSKLGLALLSIGGNEEAAAHMGINTTMVKIISFAITSTFMAAAGATYATRMIFVDPYMVFNMSFSFTPVLMAIFGGIGNLFGPVIGAFVFSILEIRLSAVVPDYYPIIFGIVLILCILYLPGGLVGLVPKLRNRFGRVILKLGQGGEAEQHANT